MGGRMSEGQEKVSLLLQPINKVDKIVEEVAGGPDGVAIECTSTRCASLLPNSCHGFECKYHNRVGEPDVIECKHLKGLLCPDNGQ